MSETTDNMRAAAAAAAAPDLTEEAFEEAFWRLYAERPLKKISVSEVSDLAGYNRGTFYLHYESLDALLAKVEGRLLDEIRACVDGMMARLEAGEAPEDVMAAILDLYEARKDKLQILLGSRGDSHFADALKNILKPLWAKYILKRDYVDGATDLKLEFTLSGAMHMLRKWMDNPTDVTPEDMAHLLYHNTLGR